MGRGARTLHDTASHTPSTWSRHETAARIPIDELTDDEIKLLIDNEATKRTVRIQAKAAKAQEHVWQEKKLRWKFLRDLRDAQAGRNKMRVIAPSQIDRPTDKHPGQSSDGKKMAKAYTEEQLSRLGYLEFPKAQASNLLGKIVAPFALPNWTGKLRPTDIKALRPVLQLADRLVLSAASVRFCHAIMCNKRVKDGAASRIWGQRLVELNYGRGQEVPVGRLYRAVCAKLHELGNHVSWQLFDGAEPPMRGSDAFTVFRKEGWGSDVFVSDENVRVLSKLRNKRARNARLTNSILRLQFYLATGLCHELMHAFYLFVTRRRRDPFFANHCLTEIGWAWEQEVLGGVVEWFGPDRDTVGSHRAQPLALVKWPDVTRTGEPNAKGGMMDNIAARRWPKQSSTRYLIPMSWINGLFRRDYWDRLPDDINLRPPKEFGFRVFNERPHEYDAAWRKSASSERHSADRRGRVIRAPRTRMELSPSPEGQAQAKERGDGKGEQREKGDSDNETGLKRRFSHSHPSSDYSVEPKGLRYWPSSSSSSEARLSSLVDVARCQDMYWLHGKDIAHGP